MESNAIEPKEMSPQEINKLLQQKESIIIDTEIHHEWVSDGAGMWTMDTVRYTQDNPHPTWSSFVGFLTGSPKVPLATLQGVTSKFELFGIAYMIFAWSNTPPAHARLVAGSYGHMRWRLETISPTRYSLTFFDERELLKKSENPVFNEKNPFL